MTTPDPAVAATAAPALPVVATMTMQLMYYRREVAAPTFDAALAAEQVREMVLDRLTPDDTREAQTRYTVVATDDMGRDEPYDATVPLPDWAAGVRVVAEVDFVAVPPVAPEVVTSGQ